MNDILQAGQVVIGVILLPCVGWLMLTAKNNGERLVSIETHLKLTCPCKPDKNK